jgi:hypothetical protein
VKRRRNSNLFVGKVISAQNADQKVNENIRMHLEPNILVNRRGQLILGEI